MQVIQDFHKYGFSVNQKKNRDMNVISTVSNDNINQLFKLLFLLLFSVLLTVAITGCGGDNVTDAGNTGVDNPGGDNGGNSGGY
jgi:hypothetical protein